MITLVVKILCGILVTSIDLMHTHLIYQITTVDAKSFVHGLSAWATGCDNDAASRYLSKSCNIAVDGRTFTVAFRHAETAIEAEPVLGIPARADSDFYRLTLRFLEI